MEQGILSNHFQGTRDWIVEIKETLIYLMIKISSTLKGNGKKVNKSVGRTKTNILGDQGNLNLKHFSRNKFC